MIAINNERQNNETNWQSNFVTMLPKIDQQLQRAFRHLDAERREDAVAEGVVHCLLSFARLHDQGRAEAASASSLAWYAALAVKRGRPAGNRMNGEEPLSRYAQVGNGIKVEQRPGNWIDLLVEDKRASVPDQVAAKIDVSTWFCDAVTSHETKSPEIWPYGCSTSEVATKHGVTAGRISQMRRELHDAWRVFQGDSMPAA